MFQWPKTFILLKTSLQGYNSKQLCELFLLELVWWKSHTHKNSQYSKKSCYVKHLDGWHLANCARGPKELTGLCETNLNKWLEKSLKNYFKRVKGHWIIHILQLNSCWSITDEKCWPHQKEKRQNLTKNGNVNVSRWYIIGFHGIDD